MPALIEARKKDKELLVREDAAEALRRIAKKLGYANREQLIQAFEGEQKRKEREGE